MTTSTSAGILDSLRLYDALRLNATAVTRHEGSNLDHFVTPAGKEIALCHLSGLLPFSFGDFVPQLLGFEWSANVALAAHHLNTGDGSIVPEVEGLDKRCKIRFTTEFIDTQFSEGVALNHVIAQTNREPGSLTERNPCAFIGATRSAVSIPTSIVTGLLGYPQVSPASTSVALDDKSQFPLFGRTLPSDDGNAVPIVRFMREVLNIKHLAIINVNDSYGNNFAQGLRKAAEIHAPDMVLYQVPLDEDEGSMEAAIASVKKTGFRYIFCLVFTEETHDLLLTEGYRQGVAGTGVHNWVFADSFLGTLNGRKFEKGSTLHKVYSGTGLIEVTGGVPGIPSFDNYQEIVEKLRNPTDLEYLASIWPSHDEPQWGTETPFINSDDFLKDLSESYSAFNYEAAISLGLAACAAYQDNETFTGQDHFDYFRKLTFTGVSGKVAFDPITGTRLPGSALYKVTNFIEHEADGDNIEFKTVVTDLFQENAWVEVAPYIFNDGTSNLPVDIAPPGLDSDDINLGFVIGAPLAALVLLVSLLWMFYVHQKRLNDTLWEVKEGDLTFSDPPKIIGQGRFGVVLLAEYRGTVVAVKRVIPPTSLASGRHKMSSVISLDTSDDMDDEDGTLSTEDQGSPKPVKKEKGHDSGHTSLGMMSSGSKIASWGHISIANLRLSRLRTSNGSSILSRRGIKQNKTEDSNSANRWKKLKRNFIHEMQYLSKLRHPCITTIMGKGIFVPNQ
jgi:Receptor family ligand binding region